MVDLTTLTPLGHDLSNVVGANVAPLAPTSTNAIAGDTQATVFWAAPVLGLPTSYTVTASPGGASVTVTGKSAIVPGLSNGTAYTFSVVATNSIGNSAPSVASNSVTPTPAPGGLSSITGLAAWWDASQIAGPPVNGASVQNWVDVSGNGYLASQSTVASQPTFVSSWTNGKPALNFSGATLAQYYITNLMPLAGGNGGTFFVVFDLAASTNTPGFKDQKLFSNVAVANKDPGFFVDMFASSGNAIRAYNDNSGLISSAAISLATPYVLSMPLPGALYTSGVKTAGLSTAVRAVTQFLWIGAYAIAGGRQFAGRIAEILYFNRSLSDAERHQIEAYLGTKYAVTMAVQ